MRTRTLEAALVVALKELFAIVSALVVEERKMHESLMKYKREGDTNGPSDFEKTMLQLYVVRLS